MHRAGGKDADAVRKPPPTSQKYACRRTLKRAHARSERQTTCAPREPVRPAHSPARVTDKKGARRTRELARDRDER
eukprot:11858149-Alexandrium_andersonii.AAC.1